MALIWLASFPKSGNTWMRAFLCNYLLDLGEPVSLARTTHFSMQDTEGWFYSLAAGKPFKLLGPKDAADVRLEAHAVLAASCKTTLLVKTHSPFVDRKGRQQINKDVTFKAINIVRNPWDVVPSYAHHFGTDIDGAIKALANPELSLAGNDLRVPQYMGDWSNHALSWAKADVDVMSIRYEDLIMNPYARFTEVVHFLEQPFDADRLDRAVRFSSFKQLRDLEKDQGFAEQSKKTDRFFRKGGIGDGLDKLSPKQYRTILKTHKKALRAFGYVTSDNRLLIGRKEAA